MLRVLIVNQYYPPDTSATASIFFDLAHAFGDAGHDVTVMCGRPSYAPTESRVWRLRASERDGNVSIVRVGSTSSNRSRVSGRLANYASFIALGATVGRRIPRPDVVLVGSDPPLAVVAARSIARQSPVVYVLRDLHPEFAIATGMLSPGRVTDVWKAAHMRAMHSCAQVVCVGDDMAERVVASGVSRDRVAVLRDGAMQMNTPADPKVVAELRGDARFVAMHAGNLGAAVPLETLAAASRRLDGDARMVFVGGGVRTREVRELGVDVLPFRPAHELASVMAAGDVQVVAQRRGIGGLMVPSKLYTAIVHGRPVLALADASTDLARIVTRTRCGVVVDPDRPDDLADAVLRLHKDPDTVAAMSQAARDAASEFDRATLMSAFVADVEALVSRNGGR